LGGGPSKQSPSIPATILEQDAQLSVAQSQKLAPLDDKSVFSLDASVVEKTILGNSIKMYAYNEQIPGPIFHVKQGDTVTVEV